MPLLLLCVSFLVVFLVIGMNLIRWSEVYEQFRREKIVHCPYLGRQATIRISPRTAALTSLLAGPVLVVRACGLWPAAQGCRRECRSQVGVPS